MNKEETDCLDFIKEVESTISLYEECTGHFASRTRAMIEEHGYIGTLEKLMDSVELQKGFEALRDNNMLDRTFEAIIIKYQNIISISKSAVEIALFKYNNPYWNKKLVKSKGKFSKRDCMG